MSSVYAPNSPRPPPGNSGRRGSRHPARSRPRPRAVADSLRGPADAAAEITSAAVRERHCPARRTLRRLRRRRSGAHRARAVCRPPAAPPAPGPPWFPFPMPPEPPEAATRGDIARITVRLPEGMGRRPSVRPEGRVSPSTAGSSTPSVRRRSRGYGHRSRPLPRPIHGARGPTGSVRREFPVRRQEFRGQHEGVGVSGVDRDFATTGPVDLVVELHDGHLAVDSADGNGCTVRIDGPRAEEFTVEQRGREIVIRPPRDRAWFSGNRHDVRVRVPSGSGLTTRTGSASVQARGPTAPSRPSADPATSSSTTPGISPRRPARDWCGVGAEWRHTDQEWLGRRGGGRDSRGRTISTGSGSVRIGTVARTQAVKTGSGDIEVGVSHGDLRVSTASGSVSVDRMARGAVGVRTASGDIRVGVMSGMPVDRHRHGHRIGGEPAAALG